MVRFRMLKVGAIRPVLQRSRIMTSIQPGVSPLRQRMTDDMRMRQLSPKTQANYLRIVREFARYLKRSPDTATVEDLRNYQLYLVDRGTSPISLNAAITGLKFFCVIRGSWTRGSREGGQLFRAKLDSRSAATQGFRFLL